ncbi:MAG: 2-oxo acid dehydrogenase subunit E2 [Phenylobacterium sp.]|uniref:dihydrolipoamide acetyltransferase family protein n=1 Tax=Phenylobacterium sp. TaxID=1871053 RepID=UPI0025D05AB1|nr:2-oxo acid dehydrogenase subunit E2 [Phenylobacterium sp.]MCG9917525.1 2-oxo acid dehydrogenase subunit E2 [Phenylobacterium sp.]
MTDIRVPNEQEGTKAIVRSWLKKVGDTVALDEPLVELETDKVAQEVPAPAAGVLLEILLNTDDEALPGAILGRLGEPQAPGASSPAPPAAAPAAVGAPAPTVAAPVMASSTEQRLSPAVRKAVKAYGVDPATLTGTGRGGRITRADVERRAQNPSAPLASAPTLAEPAKPAPVSGGSNGVRTVPHDRMRLAIAQNMLNSVTVAPHVTAVFECDFSAIMAHRRKHKPSFQQQGADLTFTAYLIAASAQAMRVAPTINSRWFDDRLEIYESVNVGIGTALGDKGLVVPIVHSAQDLSLLGIAKRLTDMTKRARDNRLKPEDMRGGTFTISNHGVSGSLVATPIIINQPQSAILGVGKLEKRVVVREVDGSDAIVIRPLAYVSLTIDHRVVDGHQTNTWLSRFVEVLETWPLDE